jgi:hypothetical protein
MRLSCKIHRRGAKIAETLFILLSVDGTERKKQFASGKYHTGNKAFFK